MLPPQRREAALFCAYSAFMLSFTTVYQSSPWMASTASWRFSTQLRDRLICAAWKRMPVIWPHALLAGAWAFSRLTWENLPVGDRLRLLAAAASWREKRVLWGDSWLMDDRDILYASKFDCIGDIKFPCSEHSITGQMRVSETAFKGPVLLCAMINCFQVIKVPPQASALPPFTFQVMPSISASFSPLTQRENSQELNHCRAPKMLEKWVDQDTLWLIQSCGTPIKSGQLQVILGVAPAWRFHFCLRH